MPQRDIIVIGASAGGVEALTLLCGSLPPDLPATVLIVQHVAPHADSLLPKLLARSGPLPATSAVDGEQLQHGHIFVAPPDRHLLLRPDRMILRRGPYENRTRPAVNALFRSAAVAFGPRVIGVVLTGLLDDGTEGLNIIKRAGGISVVQDPDDALWPSMPQHALLGDHVDVCAPVSQLGGVLSRLAREEAGPLGILPEEVIVEDRLAEQESSATRSRLKTPGTPSPMSCPACGGVLNEIIDGTAIRFRCQTGHAFTPEGLAEAKSDELERALAVAVRTHRDRVTLFRRLESRAGARTFGRAKEHWHRAAQDAERLANTLESAMVALKKAFPANEG